MQETWYAFRQTKEQEVVLYRVYGQSPVVTIPEKIAGNRVTELAAYCFAARTIPDDCLIASNDQLTFAYTKTAGYESRFSTTRSYGSRVMVCRI